MRLQPLTAGQVWVIHGMGSDTTLRALARIWIQGNEIDFDISPKKGNP
jgi:hypothetical protein